MTLSWLQSLSCHETTTRSQSSGLMQLATVANDTAHREQPCFRLVLLTATTLLTAGLFCCRTA